MLGGAPTPSTAPSARPVVTKTNSRASPARCGSSRAHGNLLDPLEGKRGRAPAPLVELVRDMVDAGAQARPSQRLPAEGGTDVIGVEVRVVPQRLDPLAERAVVATGARRLPRLVVEDGGEVGGELRDRRQLLSQLGGAATDALLHLARRDLGGAESVELPRHNVRDRPDDVRGHRAHRPTFTARGRAPTRLRPGDR